MMLDKKLKVGVVFGGPSGEYDVSCVSANTIVGALLDAGYENVFPIGIAKDGRWYGPVAREDVEHFDAAGYADRELIFPQYPGGVMRNAKTFAEIGQIDVAFPIIHGSYGEDGHLQAFFDMCRIPYVGAGMMGSMVGMDKVFMRDILKAYAIPQTDYVAVRRYDFENDTEAVLDQIEDALVYPMFVKPSCLGSSVGISKAHNREEFIDGVNEALRYDHKIVVEGFLNAREIECAVLEENGEIKAAIPGEVVASKEFYDYEAKYSDNQDSKIVIPAQISDALLEKIREYAIKAFEVIDGSSLSRVDFFVTRATYNIYINEINTMPGFTNISMYPKMWENMGVSYAELVEKLIQGAAVKRVNS